MPLARDVPPVNTHILTHLQLDYLLHSTLHRLCSTFACFFSYYRTSRQHRRNDILGTFILTFKKVKVWFYAALSMGIKKLEDLSHQDGP